MPRLPVDNKRITPHGAYGYRRETPKDGACGVKGVYPCTHKGVDLGGAQGTPVYAPERLRTTYFATDNKTRPLRGFGPGAIRALGASGAVHIFGHLDPAWWDITDTRWSLPSNPFEGFREEYKPHYPAVDRVYQEGEQIGVISSPANHVHWEVLIDKANVDPIAWVQGRLGAGGAGGGLGLLLLLGAAWFLSDR